MLALDPVDADARGKLAGFLSQDVRAALERGDSDAAIAAGREYLASTLPERPDPDLAAALLYAAGAQREALQADFDFFARDLEYETTLEYRSPLFPCKLRRFDIADDGGIYALDETRSCVHVIGKDGRCLGIIGRAGRRELEFDRPLDLRLAGERLVVAEFTLDRLQVLDKDGRFERFVTGPAAQGPGFVGGLVELALAPEDHVLVLDARGSRAHRFDTSWRHVASFDCGTPFIPQHGSRLATLAWAQDTQRLYLSDHLGRVFGFDGSGRLLEEFTVTLHGAPCRDVAALSTPKGELLFWDAGRSLLIRRRPGLPPVALPLSRILADVRPEAVVHVRWCQTIERLVVLDAASRFHFLRYRRNPINRAERTR